MVRLEQSLAWNSFLSRIFRCFTMVLIVHRAQTIIDILVKHAVDNISKFTAQQRIIIEKLWSSVKEQQIRRKQGKSGTGKLDVTGFERLQNQYSQAKISIRHSVGAEGDRGAEQWLG